MIWSQKAHHVPRAPIRSEDTVVLVWARPPDRLWFMMGIPIPVRRRLHSEKGSSYKYKFNADTSCALLMEIAMKNVQHWIK